MPNANLDPRRLDRAFALVREAAIRQDAAAVMAVARGSETVRLEAAGPAEGPCRVQPDSIFLLASISKPFFGTAIMQLVEQGLLSVTDPVVQYVPEFGLFGKQDVLIRHLLNHTSGLACGTEEQVWRAAAPASAHLEAAYHGVLRFAPGSHYEYCNLSFWVLAEIVSRLSGLPYPEYLRRHIMEPLGMQDTAFSFADAAQAGRLLPVLEMDPPQAPPQPYFLSLALPAGGLCSTAADLVRFGQAMLNGWTGFRALPPTKSMGFLPQAMDRGCPILSRAAIVTMTRLHTAGITDFTTGHPAYYGLGWGKAPDNGQTLGTASGFGHGGATGTLLWIEPEADLVFVYLTNVWGEARTARLAYNAVLAAL